MVARRESGALCPPACKQYLSLDDAAFDLAVEEAIARLTASVSDSDAKRVYHDDVLSMEMERLRRDAERAAGASLHHRWYAGELAEPRRLGLLCCATPTKKGFS
jgi:hypothetical protein